MITDPWQKIEKPLKELHLIRADPSHPLDFYWGKNNLGHYLLVLKFRVFNHTTLTQKKLELTGIKAEIRWITETKETFFMIVLHGAENADIFYSLCSDLIERTRKTADEEEALSILFQRLDRWRNFLSRAKKNILSDLEIQGLFAELAFLEEGMDVPYGSSQGMVAAWHGPTGNPHDFVLGGQAVEIKSVSGSHSNKVRISSEDQLHTFLDHLYLRVFFLSRDADCNSGLSLNGMVRNLRQRLSGSNESELFENRLMEAGYIDIPDYDSPCFSIVRCITCQIKEGFPCLVPSSLPQGVTGVSYDISISSLATFVCDNKIFGVSA